MDFRKITVFFSIVGSIAVVLELADIAVTVIIRRTHRLRNSLIGLAFLVLGILMVWLTQESRRGEQISLGPALDQLFVLLLLLLGVGSFVLRTAMSVRDGLLRLQAGHLSKVAALVRRVYIASEIAFIVFLISMLAWFTLRPIVAR